MKYVVFLVIPLYLSFAFIMWDFDCGSWTPQIRLCWAICYVTLIILLNVADRIFKYSQLITKHKMKLTGRFDKKGIEIKEFDKVKFIRDGYPEDEAETYLITWGEGTYDSGYYTYIGFICERIDVGYVNSEIPNVDGHGWVITCEPNELEIINHFCPECGSDSWILNKYLNKERECKCGCIF